MVRARALIWASTSSVRGVEARVGRKEGGNRRPGQHGQDLLAGRTQSFGRSLTAWGGRALLLSGHDCLAGRATIPRPRSSCSPNLSRVECGCCRLDVIDPNGSEGPLLTIGSQ
ncbi:hypothetical protein C8F01DRAFT_1152078 [Mycena amicta]|nr:hypothetical protein C8F01DRAFT_1152078 [Mycena amicta]